MTSQDEGIRLVLVGMMGVGKSTVGRALASRLGLDFDDLDLLLEQADPRGRACGAILRDEGEAGFRRLELEVLRRWMADGSRAGTVLASGGGVVVTAEARRLLRSPSARVVWLRAPVDVLLRRLRASGGALGRPLLGAARDPVELRDRLDGLMAGRAALYAEVADQVIDVGSEPPVAVADRILAGRGGTEAPP